MGKLGGICHYVGPSFIPFGLQQLHKQWGLPGPAHQSRDSWVGRSDKKWRALVALPPVTLSPPLPLLGCSLQLMKTKDTGASKWDEI